MPVSCIPFFACLLFIKKNKYDQTNQRIVITIRQNVKAKSNYRYRPQNWIAQSSMLHNLSDFFVFVFSLVGAGLGGEAMIGG